MHKAWVQTRLYEYELFLVNAQEGLPEQLLWMVKLQVLLIYGVVTPTKHITG